MDNFRQVAAMIKGKTPEELRKQFKITSDFTPEEEEQVQPRSKPCRSVASWIHFDYIEKVTLIK